MKFRDKTKRDVSVGSIRHDLKNYAGSLFKGFKKDEQKGIQFMHIVFIAIATLFICFMMYKHFGGT
jgi:hypothetical protein